MSNADGACFFVVRQPGARMDTFIARKTLMPGSVEPDDRYIEALLKWFAEALENWKSPHEVLGCLACDHMFSHTLPDTFMVTDTALLNQPDVVVVTGICGDCAKKTDLELIERAVVSLGGDPKASRFIIPPSRGRLH